MTEETLQEELAAASQKLIRLTRSVLNLQNRLPTTKPSSTRLTNIRKKRTELYKLCRTLRRTLSSEAESESGPGQESCGTSSHGWRPTSAPRYSESSSSSGGNCSDLQPEERSPPDSGRPAASNGPLRLDQELRSLTEQLRQDLQLPGLQVEVLQVSATRGQGMDGWLDWVRAAAGRARADRTARRAEAARKLALLEEHIATLR